MEYNGYTASVAYDDEAGTFHGRVLNLRDVITFEADTVDGLRREFRASVDDYLAFCAERGEDPERPFSGKFMVRLDPALHRSASLAAERRCQSLNAWVAEAIQAAIDGVSDETRRTLTRTVQEAVSSSSIQQQRMTLVVPHVTQRHGGRSGHYWKQRYTAPVSERGGSSVSAESTVPAES